MTPKLTDRFAYAGICVVAWIARVLPRRLALGLGALLGRLGWLLRIRRSVTLTNLTIALGPDTPGNTLTTTAARSYAEMGRAFVDFLRLPLLTENRWKDHITIEGAEHLESATAQGKGVILITGHLGSWELLSLVLSELGYTPHLVVRGQRNPLTYRFCNELRLRAGAQVIPLEDTVRGVLSALRRGEAVALLPDQNVRRGAVFVDFFGVPASTATGVAAFALRTGAPILPCFMLRETGGHRLVFEPPATFERTGNKKNDLIIPTQHVTSIIERYARAYPDRYFWMHQRWKTRPWGKAAPYTVETIISAPRT